MQSTTAATAVDRLHGGIARMQYTAVASCSIASLCQHGGYASQCKCRTWYRYGIHSNDLLANRENCSPLHQLLADCRYLHGRSQWAPPIRTVRVVWGTRQPVWECTETGMRSPVASWWVTAQGSAWSGSAVHPVSPCFPFSQRLGLGRALRQTR